MKGKLKTLVVPSMYALSLVLFIFSMYFVQRLLSNNLLKEENEIEYVDNEIIEYDNYLPVIDVKESIIKPFTSNEVRINKDFYDYDEEAEKQQNSIIYYENTYMQNSGIDYCADNPFDVVSILDGTVIDVKSDNIMGNIVEIRHTNELISVYQSLNEVNVKVDDKVVQGQIIGKSGSSNLNVDIANNLHFELYYMGEIVNPEEYYDKSLTDL